MMDAIAKLPERKRHVVIMSNGSFEGIYEKLPAVLEEHRTLTTAAR